MTGRPRSLTTLLRRRRAPRLVPEPPIEPLPGRIVHVPGRGEFFLRDSGGDGPALLLLHGWMVSADLNWITVYDSLRDAGYRVLALDHRGHGRGLRGPAPFRLVDCADDAAAVLRHEGIDRVFAVGYSMGGPIACLLARDHADLVDGLVLCATAPDWQEPWMKRGWRLMSLVRLELGLFPNAAWRASLRALGLPDESGTTWAAAELSRGSARDIAEAGRELGRYDGRAVARPPAPAARGHRAGRRHARPAAQAARARGAPGRRAARGARHPRRDHRRIPSRSSPRSSAR